MPAMADITVKKNDGTTDVTYTAISAASGDKSPAVWRSNSVGAAAGQRPELRLSSTSNGDQTARRMNGAFSYPQVITSGDTGVSSVVNRMNLQFTAVVPLGMADTDVNEAVSQALNLMAASLMKSAFKAGYAPV